MIGGARDRSIMLGGRQKLRAQHVKRGLYYVFQISEGVNMGMLGVVSRERHEDTHWGWFNGRGGCFKSLELAARDLVEL